MLLHTCVRRFAVSARPVSTMPLRARVTNPAIMARQVRFYLKYINTVGPKIYVVIRVEMDMWIDTMDICGEAIDPPNYTYPPLLLVPCLHRALTNPQPP